MATFETCSQCDLDQRLSPDLEEFSFIPTENAYRSKFDRMWCYDCDASQMSFLAIGDVYKPQNLSMDDLDASTADLIREYEAKQSQIGFSRRWFNWFSKHTMEQTIGAKLVEIAAAKSKAAKRSYARRKLDCRCTKCGSTNLTSFNALSVPADLPSPFDVSTIVTRHSAKNTIHSCGGFILIESRPGPLVSRRLVKRKFYYDRNGFQKTDSSRHAPLPDFVANIL